jgi:MFS family permease
MVHRGTPRHVHAGTSTAASAGTRGRGRACRRSGAVLNTPGADAWPSPARAWLTVAVVFLAYIVSFVDRTILSLLVEPIKVALQLTDLQIGLVSGLAFGIFYSAMGLPLGWLADRTSRRRLISAGIALWSVATVCCGLAQSFGQLFLARIAIGVGEAALAPAALSLISDSFAPARRSLAVAVFIMAGSIGGGAAMMIGGRLIGWITGLARIELPFIGVVEPWQAVFVAVGLPGLLLAAALLAMPEPVRRGDPREDSSWAGFAAFLADRAGTIVPLYAAMTLVTVTAYGFLAWLPSHFIRAFDWSAPEIGLRFGAVFLVGGAAGAWSGGWLATRWSRRGLRNANLRVAALGIAALVVPAAIAPALSAANAALALFGPVMYLFAFPSGVAVAAIQELAPPAFRGRATALYYVAINLFGLSSGAVLVAGLAGRLGSKGAEAARGSLGDAMAIVAVVLLPIATWLAWRALRDAGRRG